MNSWGGPDQVTVVPRPEAPHPPRAVPEAAILEGAVPEADIPEPRAPVAEPDRLVDGPATATGAGGGTEEDPLPLPTPVPSTVDRRRRRRALMIGGIALLVIVLFLGVLILRDAFRSAVPPPRAGSPSPAAAAPPVVTPPPPSQLPRGGTTIFPRHRVVAYYGSPGEPRLGVLGAGDPEEVADELDAAATPFSTPGREVQPAMEIIVGVADGSPGPDGDYHHDVDEAEVRRYIAVARAHKQLVVLDIQPGTTDFLTAARPWEGLLREPDVGLALDAEWRMAPGEIPGKTIGSVTADEVNTTSAWLAGIVREAKVPQKLFVVHQFTVDMITTPERVATPPELAVVQHVDGFGAPPNKLGKYQQLQRPQQFHQGFKLFYTQDTPMLTPEQTLALSPAPEFVTYQ